MNIEDAVRRTHFRMLVLVGGMALVLTAAAVILVWVQSSHAQKTRVLEAELVLEHDAVDELNARLAELETEVQNLRGEVSTGQNLRGRSLTLTNDRGEMLFRLGEDEHGTEFLMLNDGRPLMDARVVPIDDETAYWFSVYDQSGAPRTRTYTVGAGGEGSMSGVAVMSPNMTSSAMLASTPDYAGLLVVDTRLGTAVFPEDDDFPTPEPQADRRDRR